MVTRDQQSLEEKDTRKLIIEAAERLFRQIGFQKTTVADIARELSMSSANVYRFFTAKSEINEAVCMNLLGKIEAEAEKIATSRQTAAQKIRDLIGSVEKAYHRHYIADRKLHDLIEAAITENWAIMRRHSERMAAILERIISAGMAGREFAPKDATLASRLINTACIRFCHPRLIVEYEQEPEPTLDQMVSFCLAALAKPGGAAELAEDKTDSGRGAWQMLSEDIETEVIRLERLADELDLLTEENAAGLAKIEAQGEKIDRLNAQNQTILERLLSGAWQ
ncbi:MAG TPA: TetR/AcrR family transcriptional regulator [Methylocella sp.]|nr:TetR/AcrR family transcriptional regulator [Methylocella sp.]